MESWASDIEFERLSPLGRFVKAAVVNPLANYLPAGLLKAVLRFSRSELAEANWKDPGGWRSMAISYEGKPRQVADKILVGGGTMARALRNRRRLAGRLLARLIDESASDPVHILSLGAGPGRVTMDAMAAAHRNSVATLVDLSSDAFDFGRANAQREGLADRVHFIQGDVRDVERNVQRPPDAVKMLGICEYLTDEQIVDIATATAEVMPPGAPILFNSLSTAHGTDRFFRRVFGLHMNHRTPEHLQRLMSDAGFGDFACYGEPLGVYEMIIARRRAAPGEVTKG